MPTQRFALSEWLPDQPTTANTMQEAMNVVPATVGYIPFPTAVDVSTPAASSALNNLFAAKYSSINYIFSGSSSSLFKLNSSTLALDDVSRANQSTATPYSGSDSWKFVQFGDAVLATNNSNPIQYFNVNSSSKFEDLGTYTSGTYARSGTTVTVTTSTPHGFSVGSSYKIAFVSGTATDGTFTITNSDKTISNVAVTSNVVTITTSVAHNYSVGNTVLVTATTNTAVNGTYVITGVTSTTFTYAKTTSNIASTADTGTVVNYNTFTFTHGTSGTTSGDVHVYTSSAPSAEYLTIVRDFVVSANVDGVTNKVQWSDLNNENYWTSGAASQADFQIIADGGDIHGITGGEFGLILMDKALVRMSYIGSPFFFQFDVISRGLGCLEGNSVTQYGGITYFLSNDGFYSCDGQMITPIGLDKIDKTFYANVDIANIGSISAGVDPVRKIVVWNYPNISGGRSLLIYNFLVKKWSECSTDVDYIAPISTTGTSLEGLDSSYIVNVTALTSSENGKEYTITDLGTTSNAQWAAIGVIGTPIKGTIFTKTGGTGAGTGTAVDMTASRLASRAMDNTDGTVNLATSLDDRLWAGGKFLFAGIRDDKIVSFTGANSAANIIIGDIEQGYNSVINLVRAQVQDGSYDIAVSSRRLLQDDVNFGSVVSASSEGRCSFRSAGRYHRISITPTGAWSNLISIDADFIPQGDR